MSILTASGSYLDLQQETPTLFTDGVHDLLHNYDGTWTFLRTDTPTIGEGKTAQEAYNNWVGG